MQSSSAKRVTSDGPSPPNRQRCVVLSATRTRRPNDGTEDHGVGSGPTLRGCVVDVNMRGCLSADRKWPAPSHHDFSRAVSRPGGFFAKQKSAERSEAALTRLVVKSTIPSRPLPSAERQLVNTSSSKAPRNGAEPPTDGVSASTTSTSSATVNTIDRPRAQKDRETHNHADAIPRTTNHPPPDKGALPREAVRRSYAAPHHRPVDGKRKSQRKVPDHIMPAGTILAARRSPPWLGATSDATRRSRPRQVRAA